jgi:acetylornithine deacetylase/succinyl-diaminopimelate desuccinylase-like protein
MTATRTALLALAATLALAPAARADDLADVRKEVAKRHEESVARLREWIAAPAIAAEDRGFPDGPERMAKLARDAGFQRVKVIPTDGKAGVFGVLDAGAPKTVGVYFMYDVKQYDAAEWTLAPPLEGRIVDKPGVGKVIVGRGAVNQKGPQSAFLAALHALRATGRKPPVNLVLVAEGEEEIGSPHITQFVHHPEVLAELRKCSGVFMPHATQDLDGVVTINLGAKGIVELQLVASGGKWGRGPGQDIHSSLKAAVDSPVWRLVKALDTLVSKDGNTITIDGYPKPRPLNKTERALIAEAAQRRSEALAKKSLGVPHWIDDLPWLAANERLVSQPTVNIQGLVGGYTGPGGKTVLPHRAEAKIDLRLVPDMTKDAAVKALKAHLARRGYGDIEVIVSGGYDPTTTPADSELIRAMTAALRANGIEPVLWPRLAGSWPGFAFTGAPVNLPAGHFGLGHGGAQHAPDEYYVIESANPAVQGYDGAVMSYVDLLYQLAR